MAAIYAGHHVQYNGAKALALIDFSVDQMPTEGSRAACLLCACHALLSILLRMVQQVVQRVLRATLSPA